MSDTVDPRSEEPEPIIVRLREIIDDAQVTSHYEEAIDIAVQAIKDLILDIIGDDDKQVRGSTQNPDNPAHHTKRTKFRNELRAEQRGRL